MVAYRIPKGESIAFPPSHCVHCRHRLGLLDLIPVVSYLLLRGQCRYCRQSFSPQYALGEAMTGVLFLLMTWKIGMQPELAVGLFFVSILMAATLTDLRYMLIPNKIVFFGIIIALVLRLWAHDLQIWHYALGFLTGGGVLYLVALASKGGMGGGDVKLFAFIGLVIGFKLTLLAIFLSCLLGTLYGLAHILSGKFQRKKAIPFAPFITLGTLLAYGWGNDWIHWYLRFI